MAIQPTAIVLHDARISPSVSVGPYAVIGAAELGEVCEIQPPVAIAGNGSLGHYSAICCDTAIGNATLIGNGASIRERFIIGANCIVNRGVSVNYDAKNGNRSNIIDLTLIVGNTAISMDVFVSVPVGSANDNLLRTGYGDNAMVHTIDDRVVIGFDATISASATVAKRVTDATLIAGTPARFVQSLEPK
tara:strand:+ start:1219 stop:1788 length:570 start_codon:yes stop_codon:yes gene_type:complete